jgi:hypothetical protein
MSRSTFSRLPVKRYSDTRAGVLQYLRDDSSLDLRPTNIRSVSIDNQVEGVWEVMLSDCQVIVYLAGYKDPWGRTRTENDFEVCELVEDVDQE